MIIFKWNPLICCASPADGPEGLGDGMGGMSGSGVAGDPGEGGSDADFAAISAEIDASLADSGGGSMLGDSTQADSVQSDFEAISLEIDNALAEGDTDTAKSILSKVLTFFGLNMNLAEFTSETLDAIVGFLGGEPDLDSGNVGDQDGPDYSGLLEETLSDMGYTYDEDSGSWSTSTNTTQGTFWDDFTNEWYGNPYTTDTVKDAMAEIGMTPEEHYNQFGESEGVVGTDENGVFNEETYLANKVADLEKNGITQDDSAKTLMQDHADYMANAAGGMNQTLTDSTDAQTKLLADLTEQYANPVNFTIGGNEVSFIPKGSRNTISDLVSLGQTDMTNQQDTAAKIYDTAAITSPSVGKLSYLDALNQILDKEVSHDEQETNDAYKKAYAEYLSQQTGIDQQTADQGEPGLLDYLGAAAKIGSYFF